jgi:hypothetical protein
MSQDRVTLTTIPSSFHGQWRVASFRDPDGTGGPTPDSWDIHSDRIDTPDATLEVDALTAKIEPDHDLHLVNFSNNKFQFALSRSQDRDGKILVVWYLSGREVRRFLLVGPGSQGDAADSPAAVQ